MNNTKHPGTVALFAILLFIGAYAAGYYGHSQNGQVPVTSTPIESPETFSNLVVFSCPEGRAIAADFRTDEVRLALSDGRQLTLPQVISASGARYATADESFVFWNKGNGAFIQEEGDMITYADCTTTPLPDPASN